MSFRPFTETQLSHIFSGHCELRDKSSDVAYVSHDDFMALIEQARRAYELMQAAKPFAVGPLSQEDYFTAVGRLRKALASYQGDEADKSSSPVMERSRG